LPGTRRRCIQSRWGFNVSEDIPDCLQPAITVILTQGHMKNLLTFENTPYYQKMRTILLILPALAVAMLCCGQSDDQLITFRQNLRQDLPLFNKLVTRLHPVYNKPGIREQVSRKLDSLYRLNHPLTIGQVGEIFKHVSTGGLCSDAHSFFNLEVPGLKVWPYAMRIIGDRMYINQDSVSIPFGAEVTTINGRSVRHLFDILHSPSDRSVPDTAVDLSDIEAAWPALWSEEYGPQATFDVDYKWQNKDGHARFDAIPIETYIQNAYPKRVFPSQYWKDKVASPINYEIQKADHAAYLCLNTFNLSPDSLKGYMDWFFGQLRTDNIRMLLIDLTHNGGGLMNNVPLLYSYLADKPFDFSVTLSADEKGIPFREYLTSIDYNPVKGHPSREIDMAEKSFWAGFGKTASGKYEEKLFRKPYDPAAPDKRYAGTVVVFLSGETHSAACAFSALVKVNKRAPLFGMRSGGKAHFMDAGILLQYRLPNSGLILSVPACHLNLDFADNLPEDRCAALEPDQCVNAAEALEMFLNRDGAPPAYNKLIKQIQEMRKN